MTADHQVSVVGAGRMGTAIAVVLAGSGHAVHLYDPSPTARDRVPAEVSRICALVRQPAPRLVVHAKLAEAVRGSDLVIEAAVEDLDIKLDLFARLSESAEPDAVLTTNTSSIPLRQLLPAVVRPERLAGTHFWNPPYALSLVEVVGHTETAPGPLDRAMSILRSGGFRPVRVNTDIPGLIGNRLQHALKREAIALVADGICDAETVDTVAKETIGRRLAVLGPLEQSDLVGLDLTLAIHKSLMPDLDRTAEPHPYLVELVREHRLGMKSGRGFRTWSLAEAAEVQRRLDEHLLAQRAAENGGPA